MNAPLHPNQFITLTADQRRRLNGTLRGARNTTMLALVGNPRPSYGTSCDPPVDPLIKSLIETRDFGPFQASGLAPAVRTIATILEDVRRQRPDVHAILGTAGMLCCRLVRGSATAISNHSWGTAIDLTVGGVLDPRGDGKVQAALLDIHSIFNRHGFYWGAAFGIEDAMHFEASEQLVESWSRDGLFGPRPGLRKPGLTIGDRGPEVELLQRALNRELGPNTILVDGIFGKDTRAATIAFQRLHGLVPDGIASARTRAELGIS